VVFLQANHLVFLGFCVRHTFFGILSDMSDTKNAYIYVEEVVMRKVQKVTIRLSQSDFEKLKLICAGKSLSECIRELILSAYGEAKKESQAFANLIQSIDRLTVELASQKAGNDREGFLVILDALTVLAQYLIVIQEKRTELVKILDQLKEKLA